MDTSTYRNTVQQQEVAGNCSGEPGSRAIIMERGGIFVVYVVDHFCRPLLRSTYQTQVRIRKKLIWAQLKEIHKNSSSLVYGMIQSSGARLWLPRMMVWCVWKLAGSRQAGWLDAGASGALRCAN